MHYGLMCTAAHAGEGYPKALRDSILKSTKSDKALKALEKALIENSLSRSLMGTTVAVDMIGGGVKANALPELAWGVVNHRIAAER